MYIENPNWIKPKEKILVLEVHYLYLEFLKHQNHLE